MPMTAYPQVQEFQLYMNEVSYITKLLRNDRLENLNYRTQKEFKQFVEVEDMDGDYPRDLELLKIQNPFNGDDNLVVLYKPLTQDIGNLMFTKQAKKFLDKATVVFELDIG